MSWLSQLRDRVDASGWRVLQAFPGPALHARVPDPLPSIQVEQLLAGEVNADQAALFQRRLRAAEALLSQSAHPNAPAFRIALLCRAQEICAAPTPRARRLRALADYYASHAALLEHADPSLPLPWQLPVPWQPLAPGARLAKVSGPSALGPVHLHLLELQRPRFRAALAEGRGLEEIAQETGALAVSSGGFFLYSEPDIAPPSQRGDPVGLMVCDGAPHTLPLLARGAIWSRAAAPPVISAPTLVGTELRIGPYRWRVAGHNDPSLLDREPVLFNRAWGPISVAHWGPAIAIVGTRVVAVGTGALRIPLNGAVLALPKGREVPQLGELSWSAPMDQGVAGGPTLLRDGTVCIDRVSEDFVGSAPPVTFSADETFDENLLPRLGVGTRPDGSLVLACVDGRNLRHAVGLTLAGLAKLLAAQGCTQAINLDGGSSKRLWVRGRGEVDLSDTEVVVDGQASGRKRPVRSALIWSLG